MQKNRPLYFDYAATTPCDPRVVKIMSGYAVRDFGNPGSLHGFGQRAMSAVDAARSVLAESFGVGFRNVIFTGSATEANNLVLRGLVGASKINRPSVIPKIIVSSIEHESVIATAENLKNIGAIELAVLSVDRRGVVDLAVLRGLLDDRTILVSVMCANNEIGVIQPIRKISEIIRDFRETSGKADPFLHVDASQALQFMNCAPFFLGADFVTVSGHKIYGPKGIGALVARDGIRPVGDTSDKSVGNGIVVPVLTGGGQEFGLRSGTENVASIAGFAKAVNLIVENKYAEAARIGQLRIRLWAGIKKIFPRATINGFPPSAWDGNEDKSLPNILSICFPGMSAEELLVGLDLNGVAVSAGSACSARSAEPSHVLRALGLRDKDARSCLRISLGRPTGLSDVNIFLKILQRTIRSLKG